MIFRIQSHHGFKECTNEIFLIFMRIVHNLHSYIYFIYVRELLYIVCIFINSLNLILFYFVCQVCQVWFPCLTHVSTSPPPPPGGPYLVLTLVCPPLSQHQTRDSRLHTCSSWYCWPHGRSAHSEFPYKQLTGTDYSVVPLSRWLSSVLAAHHGHQR